MFVPACVCVSNKSINLQCLFTYSGGCRIRILQMPAIEHRIGDYAVGCGQCSVIWVWHSLTTIISKTKGVFPAVFRVIRVSYPERAGHTEERLNSAPESSQSVHLSMARTSPRFALHSPSAAVGLCSPWIYSFPAYKWSKQKRELFKCSHACFTWFTGEM